MFTRLTFLEFLASACGTVVPETSSKTGLPRSQLINKTYIDDVFSLWNTSLDKTESFVKKALTFTLR